MVKRAAGARHRRLRHVRTATPRCGARLPERSQGLVVDGIVGPQTSAGRAQYGRRAGQAEAHPRLGGSLLCSARSACRRTAVRTGHAGGPWSASRSTRGLVVDGIVGPDARRARDEQDPSTPPQAKKIPAGLVLPPRLGRRVPRSRSPLPRSVPYPWGGRAPGRVRLLGVVHWAWRRAGVVLPRDELLAVSVRSGPSRARNVRAGDLVFSLDERPRHRMSGSRSRGRRSSRRRATGPCAADRRFVLDKKRLELRRRAPRRVAGNPGPRSA